MQQCPLNLNKEEFRKFAKNIRNGLEIDKISKILVDKIVDMECFYKAKHIMLFYPLKSEINLLELLKYDKNFYFPKIVDDEIVCIQNNNKFERGKFNIYEPTGEMLDNLDVLDLIFVPSLAVDKENYRIGYGKGYYDRFLSKIKKAKKILTTPKSLYFDKIPKDKNDVKCDITIVG